MKILAIDTATEQCSAAIVTDEATWTRVTPTARAHADLILPMVRELLNESGMVLKECDVLAFGRGPGSFTGVRIAVGVIQGLALSCGKPVVGVSNLAAVALQAAQQHRLPVGANALVCMDARMHEVYWATYRVEANRVEPNRVEANRVEASWVALSGEEHVSAPDFVKSDSPSIALGVGTGWRAYGELRARYPALQIDDTLLPRALEIAHLAQAEYAAGRATSAALAQPVYLRDQVVARPPLSV